MMGDILHMFRHHANYAHAPEQRSAARDLLGEGWIDVTGPNDHDPVYAAPGRPQRQSDAAYAAERFVKLPPVETAPQLIERLMTENRALRQREAILEQANRIQATVLFVCIAGALIVSVLHGNGVL